jgi:hypothetical protein
MSHKWVKGISANPSGRPKGHYMFYPLLRWHRFCWEYILAAGNGAKAARKVGYSPKSARFIASRLLRKNVIRELLRQCHEKVENYSKKR